MLRNIRREDVACAPGDAPKWQDRLVGAMVHEMSETDFSALRRLMLVEVAATTIFAR